MDRSTTAYALLAFLPEEPQGVRLQLDDQTESFVGSLTDLFVDPTAARWPHLFGELTWQDVIARHRLVFAKAKDPSPNVINSETKRRLKSRLHQAWLASLLSETDGDPHHGQGWVFSGMLSSETQETRIFDVGNIAYETT